MRIAVHTKTGVKLKYDSEFTNPKDAKTWWMYAMNESSSNSVSFGRFIILVSEIDFVEVFP